MKMQLQYRWPSGDWVDLPPMLAGVAAKEWPRLQRDVICSLPYWDAEYVGPIRGFVTWSVRGADVLLGAMKRHGKVELRLA